MTSYSHSQAIQGFRICAEKGRRGNRVRLENLLAGANVPADPCIPQQLHGQRSEYQRGQQRDENQVRDGWHQPAQ